MNRLAPMGLTMLAAILLGIAGRGCGGSPADVVQDGGTDSAPPPHRDSGPNSDAEVTPDVDAASDDDADADPSSLVPPGWQPWNDYDSRCGFYVPSSPQYLPAPIAWEACPSGVVPAGVSCREMVLNWSSGGNLPKLAPVDAEVGPAGNVILQVSRFIGPSAAYRIVADADGPVHQAILETNQDVCTMGDYSLRNGHIVYHVYDSEAEGKLSSYGGGVIGGTLDAPPTVLLHLHDKISHEYAAGATMFIENTIGAAFAHPYADPSNSVSVPANSADMGLPNIDYFFIGDSAFWNANSSVTTHYNTWTTTIGTRALLGFAFDTTRSPSDVGTDGVNIVWGEGSGRTDVNTNYPVVDIMVAPYTIDGTLVQKRRLRSEYPGAFQTSPFSVGCGYAAHRVDLGDGKNVGLRIIRLADGVSWTLITPVTGAAEWQSPYAVTCTEVFANLAVGNEPQVARIAIASLINSQQPD